MYIPYYLLFTTDYYDNQERLIVVASTPGEAKEYGKKYGVVTKINQR
tara:strand:+ start:9744 stop:9884 length:141 start_codon:yes stop_codon:yes gene_type:complete